MSGEYVLAAIILPTISLMTIYCHATLKPPKPARRMIVLTKHGDTWR